MRMSPAFPLRWAIVFLAFAFIVGAVAACSDSTTPETDRQTGSGAANSVSISPQPTETSPPPSNPPATVSVGASTTPAVATPISPTEAASVLTVVPTASPTVEVVPAENSEVTANLLLAAFEGVLSGIYENVVPSVVYIRVPTAANSTLRSTQGVPEEFLWSAGSGFVWDDQGHILTNHHVVEDVMGQRNGVTVIFADSSQVKGTVVGSDPHSDLAVIKLEDTGLDFQPVVLGDSSKVKVGQLTVAIGAPFGQEFTMTSGIVSGVGRNISGQTQFTIPEAIQTDSAINPGNSGGPLLDKNGQVIGINTRIISRSGSFSGVGMAVPINIAKKVVPPLIADGQFDYPWLGVSIATVTDLYVEAMDLPEMTRGALIMAIVDGSPADRAGLKGSDSSVEIEGAAYPSGGDIILDIGQNKVTSSNELIAHLTYHNSPGDTVTLAVLRDGQRKDIEVTLGHRPTVQ